METTTTPQTTAYYTATGEIFTDWKSVLEQTPTGKGTLTLCRTVSCQRCSGTGYVSPWGVCFSCGGRRYHAEKLRVYTEARVAVVMAKAKAAADKKMQKQIALAEAAAKIREQFETTYADLIARLANVEHPFVVSVLDKGRTTGTLTPAQQDALEKFAQRNEARASETRESLPLGQVGDRVTAAVVVVATAMFNRPMFRGYGEETVYVTTMRTTVGEHTLVVMSPTFEATVGDTMVITGIVKKHNSYRNEMQTHLSRCKVLEASVS